MGQSMTKQLKLDYYLNKLRFFIKINSIESSEEYIKIIIKETYSTITK
jgi:hypothetical protein